MNSILAEKKAGQSESVCVNEVKLAGVGGESFEASIKNPVVFSKEGPGKGMFCVSHVNNALLAFHDVSPKKVSTNEQNRDDFLKPAEVEALDFC